MGKTGAINMAIAASFAQIGPGHAGPEHGGWFEIARVVRSSDHDTISRAISFRQPGPSLQAELTISRQFGPFDLAVAAIPRPGRLFDGKSQRAVHKWETQDALLLQITRPVPK